MYWFVSMIELNKIDWFVSKIKLNKSYLSLNKNLLVCL
jgi:hypothetical protein